MHHICVQLTVDRSALRPIFAFARAVLFFLFRRDWTRHNLFTPSPTHARLMSHARMVWEACLPGRTVKEVARAKFPKVVFGTMRYAFMMRVI